MSEEKVEKMHLNWGTSKILTGSRQVIYDFQRGEMIQSSF